MLLAAIVAMRRVRPFSAPESGRGRARRRRYDDPGRVMESVMGQNGRSGSRQWAGWRPRVGSVTTLIVWAGGRSGILLRISPMVIMPIGHRDHVGA